MARQPDNPHIMAVIFAAELRADAEIARDLQDFGFPFRIAPGMAEAVAFGWQPVKGADRGLFHRLQIIFGRGAANDDGKVIGRAGRCAQIEDCRFDEVTKPFRVQHRFGFLVKEGLVGRPAAFLNEGEFIFGALAGIEIDLRWQVGGGVDLFEHAGRGELRIAKIAFLIGIIDAARQCFTVVTCYKDPVAAAAGNDRGAGVLAHRQQSVGRHHRVLQHLQRHEPVVLCRLWIIEDGAKLGQVAAAQQMRDIGESALCEEAQCLGIDFQELFTAEIDHLDMFGADKLVDSVVGRLRKHGAVGKIGHEYASAGRRGRESGRRLAKAVE